MFGEIVYEAKKILGELYECRCVFLLHEHNLVIRFVRTLPDVIHESLVARGNEVLIREMLNVTAKDWGKFYRR